MDFYFIRARRRGQAYRMGGNKSRLKQKKADIAVCIPTLNGGEIWEECLNALSEQTLNVEVLVIDSGSIDCTVQRAKDFGCSVMNIEKKDFNHGGTRNIGVKEYDDREIVVFLTQDAVLASPDALEKILEPFEDEQVGAVTGKQLPHKDSTMIAKHARLYNYSDQTERKTSRDIGKLGLRTAFCSNSFSAFRVSIFNRCGGFAENIIFGEDMYLAAKMLLEGFSVVYKADAKVYHSHNYTILEEFHRYFDVGVFHKQEAWLIREFGGASGEGLRFVISELQYLAKTHPWDIPEAMLRTAVKLTAYRMGRNHHLLPTAINKKLSMHRSFWS